LLQGDDEEDEDDLEDDDHDTEELFDDEDEPLAHFPTYNGDYADDEEEEDIDEYDEAGHNYHPGVETAEAYDEEEEEKLDEDDQQYQYPASYLQDEYEDAATPVTNPQVSRATSSAPGGSADDAFVIDDSD